MGRVLRGVAREWRRGGLRRGRARLAEDGGAWHALGRATRMDRRKESVDLYRVLLTAGLVPDVWHHRDAGERVQLGAHLGAGRVRGAQQVQHLRTVSDRCTATACEPLSRCLAARAVLLGGLGLRPHPHVWCSLLAMQVLQHLQRREPAADPEPGVHARGQREQPGQQGDRQIGGEEPEHIRHRLRPGGPGWVNTRVYQYPLHTCTRVHKGMARRWQAASQQSPAGDVASSRCTYRTTCSHDFDRLVICSLLVSSSTQVMKEQSTNQENNVNNGTEHTNGTEWAISSTIVSPPLRIPHNRYH